jgi:hypothetical protein
MHCRFDTSGYEVGQPWQLDSVVGWRGRVGGCHPRHAPRPSPPWVPEGSELTKLSDVESMAAIAQGPASPVRVSEAFSRLPVSVRIHGDHGVRRRRRIARNPGLW